MAFKYNPTRDSEPPKSSFVWPILCLILLSIVGYFVYKANQPLPPPPPPVAEETPPPTPRLAPEGTFFVLNYVTVHTKSGIIGFEPGREVHLVKVLQDKQKLLVSDGQYQMEVDPAQLTNDLDVADLARVQDAASQGQLAAHQAAEKEKYEKFRHEADLEHSKDVAQMNSQIARGNAIGTLKTPLNKGAEATNSYVHTYYNGYGSPYSYFYPTSNNVRPAY